MTDRQQPYALPDDLPVADVRPGSTVLLTGPATRETRQFALRLVLCGQDEGEGAIVVTPDRRAGEVVEDCRAATPGFDVSLTGVVDCTGRHQADSVPGAFASHPVSSPSDLTGIGIGIAALLDGLADHGIDRVRLGLLSLSTILLYGDFETVSRFVHTVAGRISATDGLAVLSLDPATADEQTVSTISQLCDGRIDLRQDETADRPTIRVRGLREQPPGWQTTRDR